VTPEERLNAILKQKGATISIAESCTGGLISSRITDVPGASDYFEAGIVTYSNRAKERFLAVPHELLATKGAVSAEVAEKMAEGVRTATGADIGVSVTGIAGPGGGTAEKPVGTVYIGLATGEKSITRKHRFEGDRAAIKRHTAEEALKLLLEYLEGRAG
jgi:PncC family amidohydrolase